MLATNKANKSRTNKKKKKNININRKKIPLMSTKKPAIFSITPIPPKYKTLLNNPTYKK
jgi:hypothetical protein